MRTLTPAEARARLGGGAWVDVREERVFAAGHLPGSANLSLETWTERRHEWPPRAEAVVLVAERSAEAHAAAVWLEAAGYTDVSWLDAPWHALGGPVSTDPPARAWRPSPWLERAVAEWPGVVRGRAIDVACGTGRDAVFLACAGFDVEGWDHDATALARAAALAHRNDVALRTVAADLEAPDPPAIEPGAFALVSCIRYLHRPLLPVLARALAPGGVLVYETYREGQEQFGKPRRPRFLLRPGELREAFAGLEVLRDEEPSPPAGPWTERIVARRAAR